MRLFRKWLIALLSLALAGGAFAKKDKPKDGDSTASTPAPDKGKAIDPKKDSKKDPKKKDPKAKKGQPGATPDPANPDAEKSSKMSIPLPPGHDSKGIKIPYTDTQGNLQMIFYIGVASRLDPDHMKMRDMQVETYNEEAEPEMTIDLPESVLDLNTRIITSETRTTITRADLKLTGDSVKFNTVTKEGSLVGHVHMTIYDLKATTGDESNPKSSKEKKPAETPPAEAAAPANPAEEAKSK
jgi:hypothetical protein